MAKNDKQTKSHGDNVPSFTKVWNSSVGGGDVGLQYVSTAQAVTDEL
jgi:hypothetical protein